MVLGNETSCLDINTDSWTVKGLTVWISKWPSKTQHKPSASQRVEMWKDIWEWKAHLELPFYHKADKIARVCWLENTPDEDVFAGLHKKAQDKRRKILSLITNRVSHQDTLHICESFLHNPWSNCGQCLMCRGNLHNSRLTSSDPCSFCGRTSSIKGMCLQNVHKNTITGGLWMPCMAYGKLKNTDSARGAHVTSYTVPQVKNRLRIWTHVGISISLIIQLQQD
jgi:hypothetical protein